MSTVESLLHIPSSQEKPLDFDQPSALTMASSLLIAIDNEKLIMPIYCIAPSLCGAAL
jgi:hypothetical protein